MNPTSAPSPNELRALRAVIKHGTVRAAAEALLLSPHTVDSHLDQLRHKSGLHKIPQLVAWAALHGWLDETDYRK